MSKRLDQVRYFFSIYSGRSRISSYILRTITSFFFLIIDLSGNEKLLYEFIVRSFLACCSKDAQGQETTVTIEVAKEKFSASGLMITARNYLEVYPYDKWSSKEIHVYEVSVKAQFWQAFVLTNICLNITGFYSNKYLCFGSQDCYIYYRLKLIFVSGFADCTQYTYVVFR